MTAQPEPPTEHTPDEVTTRPFADLLRDLNRGRTHNEISLAVQDVVAAVVDTGKAGTVTLTIKFEQAGDMIVLSDDVKIKKPQSRTSSMFYVDAEYNLRRDNPMQDTLPGLVAAVRDDTEKPPLRKAD